MWLYVNWRESTTFWDSFGRSPNLNASSVKVSIYFKSTPQLVAGLPFRISLYTVGKNSVILQPINISGWRPLNYWLLLGREAVHYNGWEYRDQPWDFFGRNDAKAGTPVLWPPHAKSWLIGKDSDSGRDWGQEEKGMTEDEMAGWHHWLDGCESGWTPGVGDGQGGLACCDSWGRKESDTTETELNWTE